MKRSLNKPSYEEVVSIVERNPEVFTVTEKLRNLSLNDGCSSSSSSSGANNPTFLSTMTPTASILERFKNRANLSAFTRNVIEMTKAPFLDVHNPVHNFTKMARKYMITIGFRFMPRQGDFLIKELQIPDTLVGLRKLRDSLGLSLTKDSLSNSLLLKLNGFSNSVSTSMHSLASRILVEVITFNEGYYGRFIILVQIGIGCTVWYGFAPGDGINPLMEGLGRLFYPIDDYDVFFNSPDVHVIPGFNKITLVEGVDNPVTPLSQVVAQDEPFVDMDIEISSSNKLIIVGISMAIAVSVLFTLGINPCSADVKA